MNTKLLLLFLLSLSSSYIFAQKQITGTVTDEDNEAIPGVAVTVQGSSPSVYTVTDLNGHFSITIPQGYGNLTFSAMGKKGQTISVGSKTSIEISLISDAQSLDAVVVTITMPFAAREP